MIVHPSTPSTAPEDEIRTDLWSKMTMQELTRQHELVMTRIVQIQSMLGPTSAPSLTMMHNALQQALQQLNHIMDNNNGKREFNT